MKGMQVVGTWVSATGFASVSFDLALHAFDWDKAAILANRELIRPVGSRRLTDGLVPFSTVWFDELEQKRYQRQGYWLPQALELERHRGEEMLLLGAGLGNDALQYARAGARPVVAVLPGDPVAELRQNLARYNWDIPIVALPELAAGPWPTAHFDGVLWNALYEPWELTPSRLQEVWRLLKPGGKLILLVAAHYDVGYWLDRLWPLMRIYGQRPADPTTTPKQTARQLRRLCSSFVDLRIAKRHLRRSELPHPWRLAPLSLLERLLGRVLICKAVKPIATTRSTAALAGPRAGIDL
jgi:SAM-dependent methyltransferase